jgi:predicted metal-dependent phosphoesterase TrpH
LVLNRERLASTSTREFGGRSPVLRADLHVHSCLSGLTGNLAFLKSLDCYTEPMAVYRQARARGMDLVTITDHDSIDGCVELLARMPDASDIFIGEEVSCRWPGTTLEVHVAAYGLDERDHREAQRLRGNVHDVLAYFHARRVFAVVNHPFHFYRGQVPLEQYLGLVSAADGVEVRNGAMLPAQNGLVADIVRALRARGVRLSMVGGSDAHTLRRVGRTWTAARGTTRAEFLANLRAGHGEPGGIDGSALSLSADVYGVVVDYWKSLAGLTRHSYSLPRRVLGAGFSAVSLPFQFTPALVSASQKARESARCRAYARALGRTEAGLLRAAWGRRA